jgi:replication-associated recombination protein RarA
MKKIKIKIRQLFKFQGIDSNEYDKELSTNNPFYIKTPTGEIVKIICFVKKKANVCKYVLEDNTKLTCSDKHIIIEDGRPTLIKDSKKILTIRGYKKIIQKDNMGIDDVYDIAIPAPHLYTTPNGIIHHNTTLAKIIVQDILKCQYLYINASDENGIDTIRNKVTNFAQIRSLDGGIKVIILDEADGITLEGQKCLRNAIEEHASYTRFILTANYKHKNITAIQSRTQYFDLTPPINAIGKKLLSILVNEKVYVPSEQKPYLIQVIKDSYPDLRKAINSIQKYSISGTLSIPDIKLNNALIQKIDELLTTNKVLDLRKHLIENESLFQGDYSNLLKSYLNFIYNSEKPDDFKRQVVLIVSEYLYRDAFVVDKEVNAFACFCQIEKV